MQRPGYLLGIDLGGSSVKAVTTNRRGELIRKYNAAFDPSCSGQFAETVRNLVREVNQDHSGPPDRIGLSAPGLVASNSRAIAYLPGRLEGLEGLDWTLYLESPISIPVLNDAQSALLGEIWQGAARGSRNVILLTLGTGVGGAAMVDGHLLRGHIARAGHLGHMSLDPNGSLDITGTPGSLEDAIGNHNIAERTAGRFASTHLLIEAHVAGDKTATRFWMQSVKALGAAVASFINILDPEIVLIGGGISRAGDALFTPLQEFLDKFEWRPGGRQAQVRAASLGELAGAYGAAGNVSHDTDAHP